MKDRAVFALIVTVFLLCGCSSTKYTVYHGTEVFQGKGGDVLPVDGIDFYEHEGEPTRKYRILGMIEEAPKHRLPLGRVTKVFSGSGENGSGEKYAAIAKLAHQKGGDAVMVVNGSPEPSDDDDDGGGRHHHGVKKFVVVKYVQ